MESRCRLCSGTINLIHLFDEFGVKEKLQKKILDHMHIYVGKNDFLSRKICIICYGALDKFELFVKTAHETQNELMKLVRVDSTQSLASVDVISTTTLDSPIPVDDCEDLPLHDANDSSAVAIPNACSSVTEDRAAVSSRCQSSASLGSRSKCPDTRKRIASAVIELSDDSDSEDSYQTSDGDVYDSDVEIIETDVKPFRSGVFKTDVPYSEDRKCDVGNLSAEMSKASNAPESKPELINGRMMSHQNMQVGSTLGEHEEMLRQRFSEKYPSISLNDVNVCTDQITEKGSVFSSNRPREKGCQIKIFSRLKGDGMSHHTWSRDQKLLMNKYFPDGFEGRDIPSISQALHFLEIAGPEFYNVSYNQVRTYFTNRKTYLLQKERNKRRANVPRRTY